MDIGIVYCMIYVLFFIFIFSLGCVITVALAQHMVNTNNRGHLIKMMIQMGRVPPHLKGQEEIFTLIYLHRNF